MGGKKDSASKNGLETPVTVQPSHFTEEVTDSPVLDHIALNPYTKGKSVDIVIDPSNLRFYSDS